MSYPGVAYSVVPVGGVWRVVATQSDGGMVVRVRLGVCAERADADRIVAELQTLARLALGSAERGPGGFGGEAPEAPRGLAPCAGSGAEPREGCGFAAELLDAADHLHADEMPRLGAAVKLARELLAAAQEVLLGVELGWEVAPLCLCGEGRDCTCGNLLAAQILWQIRDERARCAREEAQLALREVD